MIRDATAPAPEKPFMTSPEELKTMLEKLKRENFPIERLESLATAADARKELVDDFQKITSTNGNAKKVMEELALYSRESRRGERFLESAQTPEKKSLFRRSWDGIKGFVKKHPYVTATLVLALAAGGVAAGFYLAGEWELLLTSIGWNKIQGLAEAMKDLAPVTPTTPPLPGGGAYDVPPSLPGPGEFPDVAI